MPETEYIGNARLARLNVSFEVRCDEHFYGEDCLTFCSNFDSCDGCGLIGFIGEFCQENINDCVDVNCSNGQCQDEVDSFTCNCEAGFTGNMCDTYINHCVDVNCNNGQCQNEVDGFTCNCEAGFTGNLCNTNINDCVDVSCNNGQCQDEIDDFSCLCDPGFTGDLCQEGSESCSRIFKVA